MNMIIVFVNLKLIYQSKYNWKVKFRSTFKNCFDNTLCKLQNIVLISMNNTELHSLKCIIGLKESRPLHSVTSLTKYIRKDKPFYYRVIRSMRERFNECLRNTIHLRTATNNSPNEFVCKLHLSRFVREGRAFKSMFFFGL